MSSARVGYLGPEGSFSHEAVRTLENVETSPWPSIPELLESVRDGEVDYALVPIENALEGTVAATVDGLIFDHDLLIVKEIVLPIHLQLLARPGVALDDVTEVHSYVHALGQIRKFLHQRGWPAVQAPSTSQAARDVAASDEPWAAVGSGLAAELFSLTCVASDIADHPGNETRFVLVGRHDVAAPTGHDRTTIVCFQDADRPGSLYGILGRFSARHLNLTRLESRPTKQGLGAYCFVIEFEGHVADDVVADCLADLQAHVARVKFLGSYPVVGEAAATRRRQENAATIEAQDWIEEIRRRIN